MTENKTIRGGRRQIVKGEMLEGVVKPNGRGYEGGRHYVYMHMYMYINTSISLNLKEID